MFKIKFSPQFSNKQLTLEKRDTSLIINGDVFDFSDMPDGSTYPSGAVNSDHIIGEVENINGAIHMTILLPYNLNEPPHSVSFPDEILMDRDGRISLPTDILPELETSIESPENED